MNNIIAIAHKELRGYFASPIAYIVLGLFALTFGFFFWVFVQAFDQQSMQAAMGGPSASMNVNEQLISPAFQNTMVVFLFILPMITMRIYAEEKRSGTIELLLTAPLTDVEIVLGKFLGAMLLYASLLAVTLIHVAVLFVIGSPEIWPIVTAYLGMLLMGGCFISVGLFISSLTKNQIVAGMLTFVIFLMLWVISWPASFMTGTTTPAVLRYLSVVEHLGDFMRGVIDTTHLVYYTSFIAFGLFLTIRSVDTERWRG